MMWQRTFPSCSLIALVLLLSVATHANAQIAVTADDAPLAVGADEATEVAAADDGVPLAELREFASVYAGIRASYVDEVDGKRLLHAATVGMLRALDPHSEYYDVDMLSQFDRDMRGRYAGIGVQVVTFAKILQVLGVIEGSPAARAGVLPGDIIERIDGRPVGASAGDADLLRGPQDSSIALALRREGVPDPIEVTIPRAPVDLPSVVSTFLRPGIAHIAITQVRERSALELRQHLARLRAAQALRGIVLDLRNNPGGALPAAVSISDSFLDAGAIVRTRSRLPELDRSFRATPGDLSYGAAIVVLVDGATASAAELIAAALQDNGRARVVGSRTFGKGSVQTIVPLEGGGAIKLTTARYFTPEDRSLQSTGVVPDIDLALPGARDVPSVGAASTHIGDAGERDAGLEAALRELTSMIDSKAS